MKIAIISDFFMPHYFGGGERRYYEILKKLVEQGYVADVYCMKIKNKPDFERIDGINIHHIGPVIEKTPHRNIFQMVHFCISSFLKILPKKYDHIEAQGTGILSLFWLSLFKKNSTSVVIHDLSSGKKDQWFSHKRILGFAEKILYHLPYQTIIVVSKNIGLRLINEFGVKKEKIRVVHNGVDTILIDKVKKEKKENSIIFVGRLIPHKHVEDLILAMRDIDSIKLKIIGSGPEKQNLIKIAKELKIEKRIEFLGNFENYKEVIKEIKKAKILVLPSTREGFGMVLAEAMYSETPVIAYESDGATEVISNNKDGILVKQRDIKMLSKKVNEFLKNRQKYKTFSKEGRKKVKKNFTWSLTVKKLRKIYEK